MKTHLHLCLDEQTPGSEAWSGGSSGVQGCIRRKCWCLLHLQSAHKCYSSVLSWVWERQVQKSFLGIRHVYFMGPIIYCFQILIMTLHHWSFLCPVKSYPLKKGLVFSLAAGLKWHTAVLCLWKIQGLPVNAWNCR